MTIAQVIEALMPLALEATTTEPEAYRLVDALISTSRTTYWWRTVQ